MLREDKFKLSAQLYKITCSANGWVYWGITYKKGKTYLDRFEEHMKGKGGKYLYREGVLRYGRDCFSVVLVEEGPLDYICKREEEESYNSLYHQNAGWNGNAGHGEILSVNLVKLRTAAVRNRSKESWAISNDKARITMANWSPEKRERVSKIKSVSASIKNKKYSWSGYWKTPIGVFYTAFDVAQALGYDKYSTVIAYQLCKWNYKITKKLSIRLPLLKDHVNKCSFNAGFGFIPKIKGEARPDFH